MNYTKPLAIITIALLCLSCLASLSVNFAEAEDFNPACDVAFIETGLPTGRNWTVTLDGLTSSANTSTTSNIIFSKHAGTYAYSVIGPDDCVTANSTGTVTVGIFSVSVLIVFSSLGNWTYVPYYYSSAYDGVEVSGGRIAMVGNRYSPDTNSYDGWLAMTSPDGNLLWERTYGGSGYDYFLGITQASDGGFAMVGHTNSFGAGGYDGWLVRVNAQGDLLWNTTFGGVNDDNLKTIVRTPDGGFILVGYTLSFGSGKEDGWLIRTDSAGKLLWNKTYGGASNDRLLDMVESSNGTLYSVGITNSAAWLITLDSDGILLRNYTYSGAGYILSVAMLPDGGFALAGYKSLPNRGGNKGVLIRVDSTGSLLWNKTYGENNNGTIVDMTTTADGGFALVGATYPPNSGWLVIVDSYGNLLWNDIYPANNSGELLSVTRLSTGGFALIGYVKTYPYTAGWLVRTDFNGYTTTIYDLKMNVIGDGSVYPGNASYTKGTSVDLVAVPAAGWSFSGWSGDVVASSNTTVTLTANLTVTAKFNQNNYTLTMITQGRGSVKPGNASYLSGETVALNAIPAAGWSFNGWSGDASGAVNTTINMDSDKTVTATFAENPLPSPSSSPSPAPSVTSNPTPTTKPSTATSPAPQNTESPTPIPSTPEFPTTMLLLLPLGLLFTAVMVRNRKKL